ncbi:ergothioneine biosynthesis protein EgtB [Immundisolibacter sp.]|uniref:ergothioneine biosynthesis protein EgtB n=1 Tax=Immundisolibacter sp. TaxID=1934948 RepID=UPI002B11AB3E|nr:ergothioneine biosynthesis protein EgtB [Immundisolibacter sp.]MEA3220524.1 Hercynine oxygenase [Immundisolibacter sp.]
MASIAHASAFAAHPEPAELADRLLAVRRLTPSLCAPLAVEDMVIQSMPDVSPPKWHLAHTSWFFETFLLAPNLPAYRPFHPRFGYLFNSYYNQVGPFHARARRGLLARPTTDEVLAYRAHVDRHLTALLDTLDPAGWARLAPLLELGLNHEQQHQELLLMDVKHNFHANPLRPAYREDLPQIAADTAGAVNFLSCDGGMVEVGHDGPGFAFDNETPRHRVFLQPYRLADRLVTCGEYLDFVTAGGYQTPELWLSDGWATVQARGWTAPLYWEQGEDGWQVFTLGGLSALDPATPVSHLSFYEADAYARFAGRRLPTEFEWEAAARTIAAPAGGNFLDQDRLEPQPAAARAGFKQMFGDVWEWTASAYLPYPRYRPAAGAVGEYNGKFMSGQMVLRGGCCLTPADHLRVTYRNFFPPDARWACAGLRLADDL